MSTFRNGIVVCGIVASYLLDQLKVFFLHTCQRIAFEQSSQQNKTQQQKTYNAAPTSYLKQKCYFLSEDIYFNIS